MNWKVILGTMSSINGGLITGAALLQTLIGQDLTIKVVAGLGIAQIVIGAVGGQLSTQGNLIKDVAAMPGVEKITVNPNANQTLAAAAVDPTQTKVGATSPDVRSTLIETAKGA